MKTLARNDFGVAALTLTVAAFTWVSTGNSPAGEAIIFPREKPKTTTGKTEKYGDDSFKPWANVPVPPSEDRPSSRPSTPRDPKAERRLQKSKEEKANWMLVNPGDLQDKADGKEFLGVRDGERDFLEKEGAKRSIFFDKDALPSKEPAGGHALSSRPPNNPSRPNSQSPDPAGKPAAPANEARSGDNKAKGNGLELGAHTSSDLALTEDLLGPAKTGDKIGQQGNPGGELSELFKPDAATLKAREQKGQREGFQKFLDNPSGIAAPNMLDPAGTRPGGSRASASTGNSLDFSAIKGGNSGEEAALSSSKNLGTISRPNSPGERPGLNQNDYLNRPGVAGGGAASPFLPSPSTAPGGLRSRSTFEVPVRSGVGGR